MPTSARQGVREGIYALEENQITPNRSSSNSVSSADTRIDPKQPRRLEKKTNMGSGRRKLEGGSEQKNESGSADPLSSLNAISRY